MGTNNKKPYLHLPENQPKNKKEKPEYFLFSYDMMANTLDHEGWGTSIVVVAASTAPLQLYHETHTYIYMKLGLIFQLRSQ